MRNKLIEILRVPFFPHEQADPTEVVADYLLDNDVVPVVRCKDCKHYMTIHCTFDGCCISDDWYCADGERKDNMEICGDNRFEIIQKAKDDILENTNIGYCPDEMKVLDSFLFRAWQMGWLEKYDG